MTTNFQTWAPENLVKLAEELNKENAALKAELEQSNRERKVLLEQLRKEWTK